MKPMNLANPYLAARGDSCRHSCPRAATVRWQADFSAESRACPPPRRRLAFFRRALKRVASRLDVCSVQFWVKFSDKRYTLDAFPSPSAVGTAQAIRTRQVKISIAQAGSQPQRRAKTTHRAIRGRHRACVSQDSTGRTKGFDSVFVCFVSSSVGFSPQRPISVTHGNSR